MSNTAKYYSIKAYEWLSPTGDASKLLVRYSIADDDQGAQNSKDLSTVIKISRNTARDVQGETDRAKLIVTYLKEKVEDAIKKGNELPPELTVTSYDKNFPTKPNAIELRLGEWHKVTIERKMGFLSS